MRNPHTDPKAGDKVTGTIRGKDVTREVVSIEEKIPLPKSLVFYTIDGGKPKKCSLKAWWDWCEKNCPEYQEPQKPREKAPDPDTKDPKPKAPPTSPKPLKRREGPYKSASKSKKRKGSKSPEKRRIETKRKKRKVTRETRRINRGLSKKKSRKR